MRSVSGRCPGAFRNCLRPTPLKSAASASGIIHENWICTIAGNVRTMDEAPFTASLVVGFPELGERNGPRQSEGIGIVRLKANTGSSTAGGNTPNAPSWIPSAFRGSESESNV